MWGNYAKCETKYSITCKEILIIANRNAINVYAKINLIAGTSYHKLTWSNYCIQTTQYILTTFENTTVKNTYYISVQNIQKFLMIFIFQKQSTVYHVYAYGSFLYFLHVINFMFRKLNFNALIQRQQRVNLSTFKYVNKIRIDQNLCSNQILL